MATPCEPTLHTKTKKKKQLKVDLAVDKDKKAFLRSVVQTEQNKKGKKRAKKATWGTVVKDDSPLSNKETSYGSDSNSE